MRRLLTAALLLFMTSTALAAEGDAPAEQIGWRVSAAAPSKAVVGQPAIVPVSIKVLPGHYIYRERTRFAAGKNATGVALGSVDFPKPSLKFDKFQNKDVEIYEEGSYDFPIPVTFDAAGETSLAIDVKSQACTHEFCLFPATQTATVRVVVAEAAPPKATPTAHGEASPHAAVTPALAAASPRSTATMAAQASPAASPVAAALALPTPAPPAAKGGMGAILGDENRMAEVIRTQFLFALLLAFVGGLGISLTPCVYPMIPITISIIGAQSSNSRRKGFSLSLVYVAGICLVYSALGLIAALSSREFGFLLQSPWMRLGIAAVFLALAASMFGAFHIELPSSVATKLSTYKGSGYAGVFITGLFSGLVAGPCTAPVLLGILLAISTGVVGAAGGFALMLAFSLGMGVLFVVIGTFSGVLAALPTSGLWMVRVKHVFGFLLLGAALYYLELVIPEWAFQLSLGATLVFAGIHLGGGSRLEPGSGELVKAAKAAGMVALTAGLFFVVLALTLSTALPHIPGLAQAPAATPKGNQIAWLSDEKAAREEAVASHKPMLIDFYADWCIDCKALDADVYTDPRVIDASKSFVPVKVNTTVDFSTSRERVEMIEALKKEYDVGGLPRVVFVRPDGTVLRNLSVTGIIKPESFLERMNTAASSAPACDPNRVAC